MTTAAFKWLLFQRDVFLFGFDDARVKIEQGG